MSSFLTPTILKNAFGSILREDPTRLAQRIQRVSTDSRKLQEGDLFVAVRGERFDGHDFVNEALSKSAAAAIVSRDSLDSGKFKADDARLIIVENCLDAIRALAKAYRNALEIPVIAIGGSNGKTTTKELTHFLLELVFGEQNIFKTKKSENSILGIAISLLQIRKEKMAVIEVGIDEPGWMAQHLEVVQPTHGLITTINEEHLEKLQNLETVAEEELKLLKYLVGKQAAFAANMDCTWIQKHELPKNSIRYALDEEGDVEGKYLSPNRLHVFGLEFQTKLPGKHNAQNLLAALSMLRLLHPKLSLDELKEIQNILPNFHGEDHRSLWLEFKSDIRVFDDCYNANPNSMENSMNSFLEIAVGRPMIAILGDMRELGAKSLSAHQRIVNLSSVLGFQHILLYGPEFKSALESLIVIPENVHHFEEFEELEQALEEILQPGQAFFLKGSRGMKMERVLKLFENL